MSTDPSHTQSASSPTGMDKQNARLAFKLVALVLGIFLVTLWKFRPI